MMDRKAIIENLEVVPKEEIIEQQIIEENGNTTSTEQLSNT